MLWEFCHHSPWLHNNTNSKAALAMGLANWYTPNKLYYINTRSPRFWFCQPGPYCSVNQGYAEDFLTKSSGMDNYHNLMSPHTFQSWNHIPLSAIPVLLYFIKKMWLMHAGVIWWNSMGNKIQEARERVCRPHCSKELPSEVPT